MASVPKIFILVSERQQVRSKYKMLCRGDLEPDLCPIAQPVQWIYGGVAALSSPLGTVYFVACPPSKLPEC